VKYKKDKLGSRLTKEVSAVCVAVKTTYKLSKEEPPKKKSETANIAISPPGSTGALGMAGATAYSQGSVTGRLLSGDRREMNQ
jgi:hypothetical protein